MRSRRGFTLLEVLVALFIFTIVAMIITSVLHTVFTSQSNTESSAERTNKLQVTLTLIFRDLVQAVNRPILSSSGATEGPFIGNKDRMTFTHAGLVNPMSTLQRSTLQRVRYRLVKNVLIRETWAVLDQAHDSVPMGRSLLSDVTNLSFEYLDQENKFGNRWPSAEQTSGGELPKAVRITFYLKNFGKLSQLYVIPIQPKLNKPS